MRILFYSAKSYERDFFVRANAGFNFELEFTDVRLSKTSVNLAKDFDAICAFVNDDLSAEVLQILKRELHINYIALRSAGFDHIDVARAKKLDLQVVRVPAYSPYAVAEHAVALLLSLVRKIHKAYQRTREGNFNLEGLLGFDIHGKTVGIIGMGKIGQAFANIMNGFGATILAYDPQMPICAQVRYVNLEELLQQAQLISLHCSLTDSSYHLINEAHIRLMQKNAIIINTGRGALIDTQAVIRALKSKAIGGLALDVYEHEGPLFFADHSNEIITDDLIMRLLSFPNVLITGHQGFFTEDALRNIAHTTLANISALGEGRPCSNLI